MADSTSMALVDDLRKGGDITSGLVMGAASLIAWPLIRPLLRPVAKTAIKSGILIYREAAALYEGTAREIGDLAKEAMDELGPELAKEAVIEAGADLALEAL
jgi:hypothetical protein